MWAIGPIALQMPQFTNRLGTLKELGELRFHAQDQIIRFPDSIWQLICGRDQSNSDKQELTSYHLSRSISLAEHSTHAQTSLLSAHFVS